MSPRRWCRPVRNSTGRFATRGEIPSSGVSSITCCVPTPPGNVADAIERVRPWGVDVASGVERAPGQKDSVKLRELVAAARAAGERLQVKEGAPEPSGDALYNWEEDLLS